MSFEELFLNVTNDGWSRGKRLDVATLSAPAKRTIHIDDHVSQLGAHAMEALQQPAMADHTPANTCANGQVDEILMPLARAILPLRQAGHVGVVIQVRRHTKMLR